MKLIRRIIYFLYHKIINVIKTYEINKLIDEGSLVIGKHSYGIYNSKIYIYKGSEAKIKIGQFCSISPDITFITGGIHPKDWTSLYPFRIKWSLEGSFDDGMPKTKGDIIIGNDVWICTGATIMSGVVIGDGAIVAANSTITKDVPPFTIVGGTPQAIIGRRFNKEQINEMLKIKWWDWPEIKIRENIKYLSSANIDDFIEKHGQ